MLTAGAINLHAQDTLRLKDLINQALEKNYQIRIVKNQELQQRNNNTYGNAGFYPTLDLNADNSLNLNNTEQKYSNSNEPKITNGAQNKNFNASLNLNWTIFDGFQMFAQKNKFESLESLGRANTMYYIEQTVSDLAKAYYSLVNERAKLLSYTETMNISRERYELEQKKLSLGSSDQFKLQQSKLDYYRDSSMVLEQTETIRQIETTINKTVSNSVSTKVVPSNQIPFGNLPDYDSLKVSAFNKNTELTRAQLNELIADQNIKIEQASYYPEINFYSSYNYVNQNNGSGFLQTNKQTAFNLGLNLRFNLFNGEKTSIAVQNSRIDKENAILSSDELKQEVESGLYDNYNHYMALNKQYQLELQNLEVARALMDIAKRQYDLGSINGFDFRQTQLNLAKVESNVTDLRYLIKVKEIDLLRLAGKTTESILDN